MNISIDSRITTVFVIERVDTYLGRGGHNKYVERRISNWSDEDQVGSHELTLASDSCLALENKLGEVSRLIEVVEIKFRRHNPSVESSAKGLIMLATVSIKSPFQKECKWDVKGGHLFEPAKGLLGSQNGPTIPGFDTGSLSAREISDDLVRDVTGVLAKYFTEVRMLARSWQAVVKVAKAGGRNGN